MALTTCAVARLVYWLIICLQILPVQSQCPAQYEFYNSCYSQLCDTPWDQGEDSNTVNAALNQFCFTGLRDCPNLGTCAQFFSFDNNYSCCAFKNYATCFDSYLAMPVCKGYSSRPNVFTTPVSRYWSVTDSASRYTVTTRTLVYGTPHSVEIFVGPSTTFVGGLPTEVARSSNSGPTSTVPSDTGSGLLPQSQTSTPQPTATGAASIGAKSPQVSVLGVLLGAVGIAFI